MTLDDALIMMSDPEPGGYLQNRNEKLRIASECGGMIKASEEAIQIARECIKRCRDFERLSVHVGDTVYWAGYDENFPEESDVFPYTVEDVSVKGFVYLRGCDDWYDMEDKSEGFYLTESEARDRLEEMKRCRHTEING